MPYRSPPSRSRRRIAVAGLLSISLLLAGSAVHRASAQNAVPPDTQPATKPPNIILIVADDLAPDMLGFEGNKRIRTPHLDRLAREGTIFRRAYVPTPQCAPGRAIILTGRYASGAGVPSNLDPQLPADSPTIARALKSRGYRCGKIGKWHLGKTGPDRAGFSDFWVGFDRDATPRGMKFRRPIVVANGESKQFDRYLDDVMTDYAIEFIDGSKPDPFFLLLSFYGPHEPVVPHPDRTLRYRADRMRLPSALKDDLSTKPPQQRRDDAHQEYKDTPRRQIKRILAQYYSMISAIDANVGRLIEHLEARGLSQNTLIVFTSDNGRFFGQHQLMNKGPYFYDPLARVPLVLWQPGTIRGGQSSDALISLVDLFPTLARRGGVPVADDLVGHDLAPLLDGSAKSVRDALFLQITETTRSKVPMLGVVTDRYKYARYFNGGDEELYNLANDPKEMINLVHVTSHVDALARHRGLVDGFAKTLGAPFRAP